MEQLLASLRRLGQPRILVVGDVMLDEYIYGRAARISPEAPVQVLQVEGENRTLGGAANVIKNLVALGCRAGVAGVVGTDANGQALRELFKNAGVAIGGLIDDPDRPTSVKTRVMALHQQLLRIDREQALPLPPRLEAQILAYLDVHLGEFNGVVLSDYGKGVLTRSVVAGVIQRTRAAGLPAVVDPKGSDYARYYGCTLITPNRAEAEKASQLSIRTVGEVEGAGRVLVQQVGAQAVLITLGEEGMALIPADGSVEHIPTVAREVYDVTGAGDTVVAAAALGLCSGESFSATAQLANLAAGLVVAKSGAATVTREEMELAIHGPVSKKIVNREEAAKIAEAARRQGKTVVFTNGCFDLLHIAHITYLQAARKEGDLFILGLNSDDSVRRLKGPQRPLISEDERAGILAALDCIHHVVIFDEDTPLDLLDAIRPDVLVKGGDYTIDGVVGRDKVEGWGGRVKVIKVDADRSTSGIVETILKRYGNGNSS